jgi:hypothetical protein
MGIIRKQQPNSVLQPLVVGLGWVGLGWVGLAWLGTLYMIPEYSGLTRNQRVTECPDNFCNNQMLYSTWQTLELTGFNI